MEKRTNALLQQSRAKLNGLEYLTSVFKQLETKVVHAGEPSPRIHGAVVMPIFQSAMFEYAGETHYDDIKYIRFNNTPNQVALHEKLAALENAESALVTASGMAAISTALLTVLHHGDHLLVQDSLYGGTYSFITEDLQTFGISYDFIDGEDPNSWKSKLKPKTKGIYVESITNPLMKVADLKGVVNFAKNHGLVSLIDNTFASPVNFRPPEMGFDISLHSGTKYLNGHADIVAGACIGRSNWIKKITHRLNHLGGSLDPHAAFLLHRGIKTLALRVKYQNQSALKIAQFLEKHPAIDTVNYPGLQSHRRHAWAREWFNGFGGMLSFEVKGGRAAAEAFMKNLTIPIRAGSLGGVETLITLPSTTSHLALSPEERQKLGISEGLIRLSVGIENTGEILEDFEKALALVSASGYAELKPELGTPVTVQKIAE